MLIAAMGEPLTADERPVFQKLTQRDHEPLSRVSELEIVAGRRGGKTRALAAIATYIAGLVDHRDVLAPGETGVLLCLAQDQRVAKQILNYCEENLARSPILRQRMVNRTQDVIELNNNVRIEVRPASAKKLRGPTWIGILADELAFWFVEEHFVNPDVEVLAAARPGLMTTRGLLLLASSPYARRGVLWDTYKKHYGPNGNPTILVAQGTSRDFNPTISEADIARELERDPVRNSAEYLAQFRADIEAFVTLEIVEACLGTHFELGPQRGVAYKCFIDAAGGTGDDSFSCAIAHIVNRDTVVIDLAREWRPPFSAEAVIGEIAELCKAYRIGTVTGDRYAGGFSSEIFRRNRLNYQEAKSPKSDLFRDLLPMLTSRKILLPRNQRAVAQLVGLERQVGRSGNDSISHMPGGHDDIANAIAGASALAFNFGAFNSNYGEWIDGVRSPDVDPNAAWRKQQFEKHLANCGVPGFDPGNGGFSVGPIAGGRIINWNNRR
jgi:hypothetical protein